MGHYVGLDVHKRSIVACALTGSGEVVFRDRFDCRPKAIVGFATQQLGRDDEVVLEATTHSLSVARFLAPYVRRVVISNPAKTKMIAAATVKTDAVDARTLADLLRSNYVPEVWQPDSESETLRSFVSFRAQLSGTRTRYMNRIRAILQDLMIELPTRKITAHAARAALEEAQLPPEDRIQVDNLLRLIDETQKSIDEVDAQLALIANESREIKLLLTLPGIGVLGACALWGTIGDVSRFKSAAHLSAYLGLTPRVKQSAKHIWYGSITKTGSRQARRLLVLAAYHAKHHPGPLGAFYRRLKDRKHGSVAAVATARKMAEIAYHMLTNGEPYRYAQPQRTQAKLNDISRRAGTRREPPQRLRVPPENEPRKPADRESYRRETVPALNDVYSQVGLPTVPWNAIPAAEAKATEDQSEYVDSLKRRYAVYRRKIRRSSGSGT